MSKRSKMFHKKKFTLSLAVLAGVAVPLADAYTGFQNNGVAGKDGLVAVISRNMTGYDPYNTGAGFQLGYLKRGLLPVAAGVVIHKAANALGINRSLASSGLPFIRI